MAKDTVEVLIEGGTATPGPPLGPALGPLGINMMQVVEEINKKSADFAGMKVPVKVIVDRDTKDFEIEIGTPPTTALEAMHSAGLQEVLQTNMVDIHHWMLLQIPSECFHMVLKWVLKSQSWLLMQV